MELGLLSWTGGSNSINQLPAGDHFRGYGLNVYVRLFPGEAMARARVISIDWLPVDSH